MYSAFFSTHAPLRKPARTWTTSILAIAGLFALGLPQPAAVAAAPLPSLSVSSSTVREIDGAGQVANVRVALSKAASHKVSVKYETVNGSAKAGSDYMAKSGTLKFPAGVRAKSVSVRIAGDMRDEFDETFRVRLFAPLNAKVAHRSGTVTIIDNDKMPSVWIGDASVTEPGSASQSTTMYFPVRLSAASGKPISVDYSLSGDSADEGDDFVDSSGELFFPAGTTSKNVPVKVLGDNRDEYHETFDVTLSSAQNAWISHASAVGKIYDNDGPDLSVENVKVREGHTAMFEVELSAPSKQDVTFDYDTDEGTAHSPEDYKATSGSRTISAGDREVWIRVPTRDDHRDEIDERFYMNISDVENAKVDDGRAVAVIDDDDGPRMWIEDVKVREGHTAYFKVELSDRSPQDIRFGYGTENGTATAPDDYRAQRDYKTIPAGERHAWIKVQTKDDTLVEGDEVFYLSIRNVLDARFLGGRATATILDDDVAPGSTLSVDNVTLTSEGSDAVLTVTLAPAGNTAVTVDFATHSGTGPGNARPGSPGNPGDYVPVTGSLTFSPGQTSKEITVTTADDQTPEPDEVFFVNLSNPVNAKLDPAKWQGIVTIPSNDQPPQQP